MKNPIIKRFNQLIGKRIRFEKRERFGVVTVILSLGLFLTQLIWFDFRFFAVFGFTILTYPVVWWGIKEDIKGIEFLTLFILPVLFSLSVSLFYFLLPVRWLTRLPTIVFYSVGIYAILLTENIYNVAANRSIQLLRAAQSVGFLMTLVVIFLFINIIFSFHLPIWENFLFISSLSALLFYQLLWSSTLQEKNSKKLIIYSLGCGLGIGETAFSFSFWPVKTTIAALFVTAVFYTVAGIVQEYFLDKLFKGVVREFMWVTIVVFFLVLLASHWS